MKAFIKTYVIATLLLVEIKKRRQQEPKRLKKVRQAKEFQVLR